MHWVIVYRNVFQDLASHISLALGILVTDDDDGGGVHAVLHKTNYEPTLFEGRRF